MRETALVLLLVLDIENAAHGLSTDMRGGNYTAANPNAKASGGARIVCARLLLACLCVR